MNEIDGACTKQLESTPRNEGYGAGHRMAGGFVESRKLSRIGVRWPVVIITDEGPVMGEVRNITMEGMFIHCVERLSVNHTYRFLIKPPGAEIAIMGKLLWSNLESAAGRDSLKGMGFSFVKVNEVHEELLREAIWKYAEK